MSETETVEVMGLEMDPKSAREAIEDYKRCGTHGYWCDNDGTYRVIDDGFDTDEDVILTNQRGHILASPSRILSAIDEATETSFVEYVRENVRMAAHEDVESIDGVDGVYITDDDNQSITVGTFDDIQSDDGIEVADVHVDSSDVLKVALRDTRGDN